MKLEHHIVVSTAVSGIIYAAFKSWEMSVAAFIAGIFIDIDHIIDYLIEFGWNYDVREFLSYFYGERHQRITLIFHGWEWFIILFTAAKLTDWNPWVSGVIIGYGQHIMCDYFFNKASLKSYSFLWRWKNNFISKKIFPRNRGYDPQG